MPDLLTALPWHLLVPEAIVLFFAIVLLLVDLIIPPERSRRGLYPLAFLGLFSAAVAVVLSFRNPGDFAGAFVVDGFALMMKLLLLFGTALVLFMALDEHDPSFRRAEGDALVLLFLGLLGALVMVSARDMALLFVAVETLSVASYALVGFKKRTVASLEGALKYVLSGATATAAFAFGASFLVGLTGTTDLYALGERLTDPALLRYEALVYIGFFFMFAALTFKASSMPFYMWTPDVYQGAPTAVTGFLAFVSKAAGFAVLVRLMIAVFIRLPEYGRGTDGAFGSAATLALIAALSMLIGNAVALWQTDAKRMLAYSSIAHAGYLFVPFAAASPMFVEQVAFYLVAYLFMTLGAFAIIEAVAKDRGSYRLEAFAGLYHRSPGVAVGMLVLLLSLAGIPLTAGFFGKWYILLGALAGGHFVLAGALVVATLISYGYYFALLSQVFMRPGETERPLVLSPGTGIVFAVGVVGSLLGGLFFGPIVEVIQRAF
ncbi:MAG: NADH-quinone oxidoreductase subunit N [Hydrogenibacillus sp.]|nr:NADH-quinone oxidoreductase subunit N [Hydrogenibacillus sp.]